MVGRSLTVYEARKDALLPAALQKSHNVTCSSPVVLAVTKVSMDAQRALWYDTLLPKLL